MNEQRRCRRVGKVLNKVTRKCRRKCKIGKEKIDQKTGMCISRKKKQTEKKRRRARQSIQQYENRDDDEEAELTEEQEEELDRMIEKQQNEPGIRRYRISQRKSDQRKAQKDFRKKYGKTAEQLLPSGYKVSKQVGKGAFGTIWKICKEELSRCEYVVKIEERKDKKSKKEAKKEFDVHRKFYRKRLTVKPTDIKFFKKGGKSYSMITMEKVDGVLDDWLKEKRRKSELDAVLKVLLKVEQKIARAKFTHGDMHSGNIGYILEIRNNRFQPIFFPIDFGWSTTKKNFKQIDLLQLYRGFSSFPSKTNKEYNANIAYLAKKLKPIILNMGFSSRSLGAKNIHKTYDKVHDKYAPLVED